VLEKKIARRYAKALFQAGQKAGTAEKLAPEVALYGRLVEETPGLKGFLLDERVPSAAKEKALGAIAEKTTPSDAFARFVKLLVQYGRTGLFPEIAEVYTDLVDEARGVLRGTVVSPTKLDNTRLSRIKGALERCTGRTVELETHTDPNLLAGFRVEVADVVLDASVRGQLGALAESMAAAT
jgi:F-type H+-transporting ATPase subunit delta